MTTNATPRTLLTGLGIPESARWHDGRLWLANWGFGEVLAVDLEGRSEVMAHIETRMPISIDWLPDGRLLAVSGREALLVRQESDGALVRHADLSGLARIFNEIVVDDRGNAYVNGGNFDLMAGEAFEPGIIALASPDGSVREVADGILFPNGMAITPDGRTLLVAESYGDRITAFDIEPDGDLSNRRVWAAVEHHPDGITMDAEGAVWYADVGSRVCVRVREGGEVLQTIELEDGCFACALGGPDGRTLFMLTAAWHGAAGVRPDERAGRVLAVEVAVPHAGRP